MMRLPTEREMPIIKAVLANPVLRNRILVRNGLAPKTDDLPCVEYICKGCQGFANLPIWDREIEDLDLEVAIELEERYFCPECGERMVRTDSGED